MTADWTTGLTDDDAALARRTAEEITASVVGLLLVEVRRGTRTRPGHDCWDWRGTYRGAVILKELDVAQADLADDPPGPDRDVYMREIGTTMGEAFVRSALKPRR